MGKPRTPPEFMSKRKKNDLAMPVSWRSLKPSSSRKSSSRIAVRKRLIMASRLFIGSVILLLGGFFLSFQINETSVHAVGQSDYTGPSQPIDRVVFRSDGALNHKWFLNWMGPLRGLSLYWRLISRSCSSIYWRRIKYYRLKLKGNFQPLWKFPFRSGNLY